MSQARDKIKRYAAYLLALIAGALAPLSLNPVNIWPLALLSVCMLMFLLQDSKPTQAAALGWCYGLGFFGLGASWVYVSINVYGNASGFFSTVLTLLFVASLALLFALQCWLYQRFFSGLRPALGFAACWVLFEWFRGWFLTGFPWLYLGYAHINTWLGNLAPILGVFGVSFAVVFISGLLFQLYQLWRQQGEIQPWQAGVHGLSLLLLLLSSLLLGRMEWVQPVPGLNADVALVQANIDQNLKFDPAYIDQGLDLHNQLSAPLWNNDIVIWPETAIPMLYQRANVELGFFSQQAAFNGSTLVTGILYQDGRRIYNSITAVGNGAGIYHKQKLVPFGEYIPLRSIVGPVMQIFALPMSSLAKGPGKQELLHASGYTLASYICYEVVYPDFVRRQAHDADFLVTISNDTWFGASFGPLQHLQMAAMRALENGRYMIRATSNGVTAFINERGRVVASLPQFEAATLSGNIPVFSGRTPFSYWGSWPVIFLCVAVLALIQLYKKRQPEP